MNSKGLRLVRNGTEELQRIRALVLETDYCNLSDEESDLLGIVCRAFRKRTLTPEVLELHMTSHEDIVTRMHAAAAELSDLYDLLEVDAEDRVMIDATLSRVSDEEPDVSSPTAR